MLHGEPVSHRSPHWLTCQRRWALAARTLADSAMSAGALQPPLTSVRLPASAAF